MRSSLVLIVSLLAGCSDAEPESTLRDTYIDALCKLYVEPDCIESTDDSCMGSISFDTMSDCTGFLRFALSACEGSNDVINANPETVQECIDLVEDFDCATEPVCDSDGENVATSGACGEVDALLEAQCPDER